MRSLRRQTTRPITKREALTTKGRDRESIDTILLASHDTPPGAGRRPPNGEGRPRGFLLSLGLMVLLSPVVTHASDSSTSEPPASVVLGTLEPDSNFPWGQGVGKFGVSRDPDC